MLFLHEIMPKVIKCGLVPEGFCINLFGVLLARDTSWIDRAVINHELIHTYQQREMLYIPFYLWYVVEWLVKLAYYRNWMRAYRSISFEREAYSNGNDFTYLPRRRRYAWMRYLRR